MRHLLSFRLQPSQPFYTVAGHLRRLSRERTALHLPGSAAYTDCQNRAADAVRLLYSLPPDWNIGFTRPADFLRMLTAGYSVRQVGSGCLAGMFGTGLSAPQKSAADRLSVVALSDRDDGRKRMDDVPGGLVDLSHTFPVHPDVLAAARAAFLHAAGALGLPFGFLVVMSPPGMALVPESGPDWVSSVELALLAGVLGDLMEKGLPVLEREAVYKAALVRNTLESIPFLQPLPPPGEPQATNVHCASTSHSAASLAARLEHYGLLIEAGDYGHGSDNCIRIATYPVHSREQVEMLADRLTAMSP
jgi:hypothetical protein